MKRVLKRIKEYLLYAIFPNKCIFCGKTVGLEQYCCEECAGSLPYVRPDVCPHCSKDDCVCNQEKFKFDSVAVPFYYGEGVSRAILRLKFSDCTFYAKPLAYYMAKALMECEEVADAECITYMMSSKKHLKRRGYNQAELLAQELSKLVGIPCMPLAEKIRETEQQHKLSGKERRKNLKGAFEALPDVKLKGKTIIVCDDVLTTGSSLSEFSSALKKAGAQKIIACVVASTYCRN